MNRNVVAMMGALMGWAAHTGQVRRSGRRTTRRSFDSDYARKKARRQMANHSRRINRRTGRGADVTCPATT